MYSICLLNHNQHIIFLDYIGVIIGVFFAGVLSTIAVVATILILFGVVCRFRKGTTDKGIHLVYLTLS